MEKKSRMEKYEELRKKMFETKIATDEILDLEKEVVEVEKNYNPTREKVADLDFKLEQFNNEYLDEFIKEVKEYNIKKGNAYSEDTQVNILKEMANQAERENYVEEIEEVNYFDDISQQIEQLLNEVNKNQIEANKNQAIEAQPEKNMLNTEHINTTLEQEIQHFIPEEPILADSDINIEEIAQSINKPLEENYLSDFEEHTKQISLKIDEYQENIQKQTKKNFMLNLIIIILIILILVIIGIAIIYAIYKR